MLSQSDAKERAKSTVAEDGSAGSAKTTYAASAAETASRFPVSPQPGHEWTLWASGFSTRRPQRQCCEGSDEASEENGTYTFHGAFDVDFSGVYDGQGYAGHYAEDLTWTFAFTSETSGIETVNGSWSQTFDGESVSVTLETTDPLVIDASCESGIVAGTVVATSGDASETITWTGCDEYSLSYEGS